MSVRSSRYKSSPHNQQKSYIRARDDRVFDGMRRSNSVLTGSTHVIDFQENIADEKNAISISKGITYGPPELSPEDIIVKPHALSSSEKWYKISSSPSLNTVADLKKIEFEKEDKLEKTFNRATGEAIEVCPMLSRQTSVGSEISYSVKKGTNEFKIQLPPSAASFYTGNNPQIEIAQSCEGITKLNIYLKAKKDEVVSGIPGKFLHAVLGQDLPDIGSVASTIMYAFYLNEMLGDCHLSTVPVVNIKRADFDSHAELKWLLESCRIDHSSLVFVDEIDLSYYDLFGSLQLVLLNGNRLPVKQETLKEALVEIFNCRKDDPSYPWVQNITNGQDCSCCTLIAEKFLLSSPQILAGQGFSRLLLAGILFDTGNFTNAQCASIDKYMATLLINGAGRYGCNGLYQILRYKMYDVSSLKLKDILRKDLKKWTRVGKPDSTGLRLTLSHFGMSSIGMPVGKLLAHDGTSVQEITNFQNYLDLVRENSLLNEFGFNPGSEKLRLLMVVSGYYDSQKNFKREILVSTEYDDLMENLLLLFKSNSSQLLLTVQDIPGLGGEMRAFEIDRVVSRRTIEKVLEEFSTTSKY